MSFQPSDFEKQIGTLREKYLMADLRVSCRTMFCQRPVVTLIYGMFYDSIVENNPFNHPLEVIEYRSTRQRHIKMLSETPSSHHQQLKVFFDQPWKREGDWDKSSSPPL